MNVWFHLPTIFGMRPNSLGRKRALRNVGLLMLCVALITTLFLSISSRADASANKTISFQGRLLDTYGGAVPDGYYNMQFKIYENGAGDTRGNPDGSLKWTESYVNNGSSTGAVQVKSGSFSVNLGSKTSFGNSVNWDNDTIWLSMNVAGRSATCSTFGTGPCEADGEMLPMKRMTATPYAMNSGSVGGKSANDLVQLGQGAQTDSRNDVSSIFINKTGTGNLLQLQNSATDIFTVTGSGDIVLGGNSSIQSQNSITINTNGTDRATFSDTENSVTFGNGVSSDSPDTFTIQGTDSTADGVDGGSLVIQGGDATVGDSNGGNIIIGGGSGSGTGASGLVVIKTPTFQTAEQQNCDEDCAVLQSSIDDNGAIMLNAEETGLTFTLNDPTITTAGRVFYVSAANNSEDFTISINGGGASNQLAIKSGTTTTLFWNGSNWTTSGSAGSGIETNNVDGVESIRVGKSSQSTTLLTLDKGSSAPDITDEDLLGSMYYDTTIGKVQCYEAAGWGECGAKPDIFVTLSPEYSNAVTNGSTLGDLTSDICSDTLSINDGSSSQPQVCGQDETYNFYNWTSTEATSQTKSIFVSYQLPSTFREFAEESLSLNGRTDSSDASVSYQIYRNGGEGLVACGSSVSVSTGAQTQWQKAAGSNLSDPANCDFSAGDSIVIKIDLVSSNGANAYVSDLGFVFSNR